MKILVINDVHAAASPPASCRPEYVEDVFNLLEEAKQIALEQRVSVTVFTGDLFHKKNNVPTWLVTRLMKILKGWYGQHPPMAIVGNHDLGPAGLSSIPEQPIGALFESGLLFWLNKDRIFSYSVDPQDKSDPWGNIQIHWSPANYFDGIDDDPENYAMTQMPDDDADWRIKVAHGSIMLPKKEFPFQCVRADDIPRDNMDLFLFGHIHNNQGIKKIGDTVFASLGSLGRVARTDYNRERKMELLLVNLTKDEMTFEKIPLTSGLAPDDLYYEKEEGVELDASMARFAKDMERMVRLEDVSLDEVLEQVVGAGVEPAVKRKVKNYLTEEGF